jgi:hypothetical protein
MYLNAGSNKTINQRGIIGIFDLDTSTISAVTRKFLNTSDKAGIIETVQDGIPKSFILTDEKIYITQISTAALKRRLNENP